MISRFIEKQILTSLNPCKVVCLFGARRTGKTVLMTKIKNEVQAGKVLMVHGENLDIAEILSSQRTSKFQNLVSGYTYLFIDEAQKIPHIGSNLKLMIDTIPCLSIFVRSSGDTILNY